MLVSWVGEADANEGKLEKIKNNLGEPWTVTDEINANTLINLLVVIKAKSAVTIYRKFAFDWAVFSIADGRGGLKRVYCDLDRLRCLTSVLKKENSTARTKMASFQHQNLEF